MMIISREDAGGWGSSGFSEWEGQLSDAYFGFQEFASDLSVLAGGNNYEVNAWYRDVGADNDRSNDFMTGIELVTYNKSGQKLGTQSLYEWEPGGGNSGGSQTLNNATNASLIGGGITGIVNGAFKTAEQGVKSIALTPAAIQAEKFAQGALNIVKGASRTAFAGGMALSFIQLQQLGFKSFEGWTRFTVDVAITGVGFVPYIGAPAAITLGSMNVGGAFDPLYQNARTADAWRRYFSGR